MGGMSSWAGKLGPFGGLLPMMLSKGKDAGDDQTSPFGGVGSLMGGGISDTAKRLAPVAMLTDKKKKPSDTYFGGIL